MRLACLCLLGFAFGCQSATAPDPGCTIRYEEVVQFEPFIALTFDQCFPVCPPNAQALADSLQRRLLRDTHCPSPTASP